jgi:hypothetical protein
MPEAVSLPLAPSAATENEYEGMLTIAVYVAFVARSVPA